MNLILLKVFEGRPPFLNLFKKSQLLISRISREEKKRLIMRLNLFILILFTAFMQVSATSLAQKVSINKHNVSVIEILEEVKKQTGYGFIHNSAMLKDQKVSIQVRNLSLKEALDQCFQDLPLSYSIVDHNILIKEGVALKQGNSIFKSEIQEIEITGRIVDQNGVSLPGVTVKVKDDSNGTFTNQDGYYQLKVKSKSDVLVFSFLGFISQEVTVNNQTVINIELKESLSDLEEVVVVGYGTQRRSDLTGAIGSVKGSELMERPAVNVEQALAGRIPGVNVATNSGRPGGRTNITIRGYSSINASNDPLYVVDGVIWTNGINTLNPNDIQSIDVLKDASSTAIYGTRGSNGVIIITTKKGRMGHKEISYDNYLSLNWLPSDRKYDVLNSKEFLFIEEEQYKNASKFDPVGFANGKYQDPISKRQKYLVGNQLGNRELFELDANGVAQPLYDVDWQDLSTRKALSQNHNLSLTGSDENTTYGFSMGLTDEQGIIKESFQKRYNVRAVVDQQFNSWFKMGINLRYANNSERRVDESVGSNNTLRQLVEMVSFIPYKYEDGTYGRRGDYAGLENGDNPLAQLYENNITYNSNLFNGTSYVNLSLFPGFEFTSTFGANILNDVNPYFNSTKSDLQGGLDKNYARIRSAESKFWQWSNRVNYTTSIDNHRLNLLAGTEIQKYNSLNWAALTSVMPDDYYSYNNLGAGSIPLAPSSSANSFQMQSFFGRVNYSYNEKYLVTATGRSDGSSRFGTNNKYAFFPSGALAWRISNEDFLQGNNLISNLKLRTSYGLTGNSEIGSYKSMANLSTNSYIYAGSRASGSAIGRLANPNLKWEKTAQFDLGIDAGILNDRIQFEADYFLKKTQDLLFDAPVPATSGYTIVTRNIGNMENKGFEFSLTTLNINNPIFSWTTNLNFSKIENKITALGVNNEDILYGTKEGLILRVGESAGSFYGYTRDGIWSTDEAEQAAIYGQKPGDLRIKDLNNDKVINAQDRAIIGKGIPDFYGSFTNSFKYKSLDLIIELQFSKGNDVFNQARNSGEARQGLANSFATVLDAWTPENQNAVLEQVRPTSAGYNYYMDTRKVSDGSFIRGKNLALGYNLPKDVISKVGISNFRVFASVQNFFLATKYFGYDPEVTTYEEFSFSQGFTYYEYPKPRTFMFGVNLNF